MSIDDFWNKCHEENNISYLSGCSYEETIEFLKVAPLIKKNIEVLEVGVGVGNVTKGLYNKNISVSCLDISTSALKAVKKFAICVYTLSDLEKLPENYFDLIICHNVVQHVETNTLLHELKYLIGSLKSDGVFALEFVSNNNIKDSGVNCSLATMKNGGCFRQHSYFSELIALVGGSCELVFTKQVKIGEVHGVHVFHIRKNNEFFNR